MADNRSFEPATAPARRTAGRNGRKSPGEGAPAGLDMQDPAQGDRPEEDWGEPGDPGTTYSANHTRRPAKTEAQRGQGRKTRRALKDQISRRV